MPFPSCFLHLTIQRSRSLCHLSGVYNICQLHLEALSNLGEHKSLYNNCSGVISSTLGNQNNICFSVSSQQNGSLLRIVLIVLTSSNLSCLYDICQDGKTKLNTLVTESRGLYGGSYDPKISSNLLAGINQVSSIQSNANLNFHINNIS
jgi:hypothetical protein